MGDVIFHDVKKQGEVYMFLSRLICNENKRSSQESNNDSRSRSRNYSVMSKQRTATEKHTPNTSRDARTRKTGTPV